VQTVSQKIGDSLQWHLTLRDDTTGLPVNLTGGTLAAELRGLNGGTPITPVLTLANQGTNPGEFDLVVADGEVFRTAPQPLFCDIQFELTPGIVTSSETFIVALIPDITA
jgi:hypothetical protein